MTIATAKRYAIDRFDWLEPFQPHQWFRGGWLQTISVKAVRPTFEVDDWEGATKFQVCDGASNGDMLSGFYLPPHGESRASANPTVILFHGMGGHAQSGYMRSLAQRLLEEHYHVILWNNRGAGCSAGQWRQFHHPGRIEDVRLLVDHLHAERTDWTSNGLVAIAFSLGANLLLRYLADRGSDARLQACVSISAPLDMRLTSQNLRRGWNKLFDRYLLKRLQSELLRGNAELSEQEREVVCSASSVWEMDDRFTGPRFGFAGAEEFYKANSAIHVLDRISVPTLLIHAADDPVVDASVFDQHNWSEHGPLFPALTDSGGHTGFLDPKRKRWHEQASIGFLKAHCC